MPLPPFPVLMFLNSANVRLATDTVGGEGGANPTAGTIVNFLCSVQAGGTTWEGMEDAPVSRTQYTVRFRTDPALRLSRAIAAGDQIEWGALVLSTLGGAKDIGGYGWAWVVECEHVSF